MEVRRDGKEKLSLEFNKKTYPDYFPIFRN
jgi:hypothetical protein